MRANRRSASRQNCCVRFGNPCFEQRRHRRNVGSTDLAAAQGGVEHGPFAFDHESGVNLIVSLA
jgi:hypothetical protein